MMKQEQNQAVTPEETNLEQQMQAESETQGAAPSETEQKLQACQTELADWKDRFMHVTADMQNYKRRMESERVMWAHRAQEKVLLGLLAIVDDFDRALAEHEKVEHTEDLDAWLQGFELIGKSLYKYLASVGVQPIEQVNTFDPELHEAVVQIEAADKASGDIVEVMLKGYMFNDAVLRPAKVVVAK